MRESGGRHELKHDITPLDRYELRARLPYIMKRDEHAVNGKGYRVRSLYFDNYDDKVLKEKVDGFDLREKFRIRIYNDDAGFIRLEKKSKQGGMCFKIGAGISEWECNELLAGNFLPLKENGHPLLLELYTKMQTQLLRPKNIVDYMREAFVYPAANVRVTLDDDIRGSSFTGSFLNRDILTVPVQGAAVLEVKYDNFLPEIIRGIVTLKSRHSTAFSKYAVTRTL